MGVSPALAQSAIRISIGPTTVAADIDRFLLTWRRLVESLSKGVKGIAA
jgi:cysteine sulfinate desulfinase/cysteine desulfurase-like protein